MALSTMCLLTALIGCAGSVKKKHYHSRHPFHVCLFFFSQIFGCNKALLWPPTWDCQAWEENPVQREGAMDSCHPLHLLGLLPGMFCAYPPSRFHTYLSVTVVSSGDLKEVVLISTSQLLTTRCVPDVMSPTLSQITFRNLWCFELLGGQCPRHLMHCRVIMSHE